MTAVGTAVVISGIPQTALSLVRERLRVRYPQGYVFRFAPTKTAPSKETTYDSDLIKNTLEQTIDAVFGTSRRPLSFCKNSGLQCGAEATSGKTCGKTRQQSCVLRRPRHLLLFYQEGPRKNALSEALFYAPLVREIPKEIYGKSEKIAEHLIANIDAAKTTLSEIESQMTSRKSPFLLPPLNFQTQSSAEQLIKNVNSPGSNPAQLSKGFKSKHFDRTLRAYRARGSLKFEAPIAPHAHGSDGPEDNLEIALSRAYRLGCTFDPGRHWDVQAIDGRDLGGRYKFTCRLQPSVQHRPSGDHINVLVHDCLR